MALKQNKGLCCFQNPLYALHGTSGWGCSSTSLMSHLYITGSREGGGPQRDVHTQLGGMGGSGPCKVFRASGI